MLTNLIIVSKKIVVALKEIYHPEHKDMYYPINYSYAESIMAPDEEGLPVGSADCKAGKCRYVDCAVGSIVARCR